MTKTLADIIIHLAGSISNEKALAMRNACDALEGRIDALERVLSRHAETLGFLDYERVQPLEARVSTLEASQPSTQNAWDAYRFVMDSEHPGAAYRDVERMAVDAAVRATTNTGDGASTRKGDGGTLTGQATVSSPSPAPSASAQGMTALGDLERNAASAQIDAETITRIYTSGYRSGHHDTVEGQYTDVHPSEEGTYLSEDAVAAFAALPASAQGEVCECGHIAAIHDDPHGDGAHGGSCLEIVGKRSDGSDDFCRCSEFHHAQ